MSSSDPHSVSDTSEPTSLGVVPITVVTGMVGPGQIGMEEPLRIAWRPQDLPPRWRAIAYPAACHARG